MNRIKMSVLAASPDLETEKTASAKTNLIQRKQIRESHVNEFSFFLPLHYEPNYAYPLIVWLHSDGHSANQIQQVMLEMSLRNYVGVGVCSSVGNPQSGFCWDQEWDTIDLAYNSVTTAIENTQQRCQINSRKIFLAGAGSGGTMAFRLAFSRPDLFAGVLSIDGQLPATDTPLLDWEKCRSIPIFWAHDNHSPEFSQTQLCQQLKLLYVAGFKVKLCQYRKIEMPCSVVFSDANQWIMETIDSAVF